MLDKYFDNMELWLSNFFKLVIIGINVDSQPIP